MGIQFRKHRENEQEKIFLLKFMDYLIRIEAMIVLGTIPLLEIDFFSVLHHDALLIET